LEGHAVFRPLVLDQPDFASVSAAGADALEPELGREGPAGNVDLESQVDRRFCFVAHLPEAAVQAQ